MMGVWGGVWGGSGPFCRLVVESLATKACSWLVCC